ncbi:hypothetical protein OE88DRAFT_1656106 [Heliocybe sulcata]|uniref:Uncharacterized protein n=1 Tax=Heliocybe sulcata TaxID=5364 RepID=A0A5C3N7V5_9AGAM|nr:hypothetical protein OE88DRAFT_1656106 [Heliocybe sulcata]
MEAWIWGLEDKISLSDQDASIRSSIPALDYQRVHDPRRRLHIAVDPFHCSHLRAASPPRSVHNQHRVGSTILIANRRTKEQLRGRGTTQSRGCGGRDRLSRRRGVVHEWTRSREVWARGLLDYPFGSSNLCVSGWCRSLKMPSTFSSLSSSQLNVVAIVLVHACLTFGATQAVLGPITSRVDRRMQRKEMLPGV